MLILSCKYIIIVISVKNGIIMSFNESQINKKEGRKYDC